MILQHLYIRSLGILQGLAALGRRALTEAYLVSEARLALWDPQLQTALRTFVVSLYARVIVKFFPPLLSLRLGEGFLSGCPLDELPFLYWLAL